MPTFRSSHSLRVVFALLLLSACAAGQGRRGPKLEAIDEIMERAITAGEIPGAVVVVGHKGRIVYRKVFGSRALEPQREPMTVDTVFDVASLTKPVATAMSVMRLVELGLVRLNDPASKYVPEFGAHGKDQVTVRQLLTHFGGLRPDIDLDTPWTGRDEAMRRVWEEKLIAPPGARFIYSDIGYIVLGEMVNRVSGMPLERYAEAHIFQPLGMRHTRFLPPEEWRARIAPTQYDENRAMLRGVVHDPTARRMGGMAGHAGLFSTADDLARFAQKMLERAGPLSPVSLVKMTTPQQPPTAAIQRGLGWDIDSPYASNRGELLPVGSFGHTGFTGTSLWMDPVTQTFVLMLANFVHPRGGPRPQPVHPVVSLRSRLATAVAAGLGLRLERDEQLRLARLTGYNEAATAAHRPVTRSGQVRTGVDVLQAQEFYPLRSTEPETRRRVGLFTNHTGRDREGRRTIDLLAKAPGVELAVIFSPEHGADGALDTESIEHGRDAATGVPIHSLYGATEAQRRVPRGLLKRLDAVVVDIQDAGARFYTYITSLGYVLEDAARAGVAVYVLDRPNPIGGVAVQGPLSERARASFTSYHPIPVRHGMTLGELALLFNAEREIGAELTVVAMEGWLRGDWFDSTGLEWVGPSPNLRSLTQATLYPGVALIEYTNVSVGRGTDTPFEVVGAPWIDGRRLAEYLNGRQIAGARFVPVSFTPREREFAGELCRGVNIIVTDRHALDAPELGVELASALLKLYPEQFQRERLMTLLANERVYQQVVAGWDPRRIADEWRDELLRFEETRRKYLIYPVSEKGR